MDKNLTVRFGEQFFNVSMTSKNKKGVILFISWIKKYKHGKFDSSNFVIECETKKDFIACRKKAKYSGLVPVNV